MNNVINITHAADKLHLINLMGYFPSTSSIAQFLNELNDLSWSDPSTDWCLLRQEVEGAGKRLGLL